MKSRVIEFRQTRGYTSVSMSDFVHFCVNFRLFFLAFPITGSPDRQITRGPQICAAVAHFGVEVTRFSCMSICTANNQMCAKPRRIFLSFSFRALRLSLCPVLLLLLVFRVCFSLKSFLRATSASPRLRGDIWFSVAALLRCVHLAAICGKIGCGSATP